MTLIAEKPKVLARFSQITIEEGSEGRLADAAGCLARCYLKDNPLMACSGLAVEAFEPIATYLIGAALEAGIAVFAVDESRNRVVGVSLAEDYAHCDPIRDMQELDPLFHPLLNLFGVMDERLKAEEDVAEGQWLYHAFLNVESKDIEGVGVAAQISAQLCEATFAAARAKGYQFCVGHTTNLFSQRLYRKMGFEPRVEIAYRDYVFNGEHVYADVKWHHSAVLGVASL